MHLYELAAGSRIAYPRANDGFVQGMRELGYVNEKDYVIEWRSVEGNYERIPEIAAEFVRLKVDVIVTALGAALPTLQRAITTIPHRDGYLDRPGRKRCRA